jgi:hypothetical protein
MQIEDAAYLIRKELHNIQSDLNSLYTKRNRYDSVLKQILEDQDLSNAERMLVKDIENVLTNLLFKTYLLELKLRDVQVQVERQMN